jgi:hypothetical protein
VTLERGARWVPNRLKMFVIGYPMPVRMVTRHGPGNQLADGGMHRPRQS